MKKLLLLPFFVLSLWAQGQYDPSKATVTNKPLGVAQGVPTDARSYYYSPSLFIWRPYQSTAEVLSSLNIAKFRMGNFPIYVNVGGTLNSNGTFTGGTIKEYWFKDGTTDADLVEKFSAAAGETLSGTIAQLRALTTGTGKVYTSTDRGGGSWVDIGVKANDDFRVDDGATLILSSNNHWMQRQINGEVYATWFGAVGNGSTVNTNTIQAALNYAGANGMLKVHIPSGNFVTSTLNVPQGVSVVGDGMAGTKLIPSANSISVLKFLGVRYTGVSDIQIDGAGKTGVTAIDYGGDASHENTMIHIKNVLCESVALGLKTSFSYYGDVSNLQVKSSAQAFSMGNASNSWSFSACSFFTTSKGGEIVNSAGVSFTGTTFEHKSWVELFNSDGISWTGGYFEDTDQPSTLTYWILAGSGGVTTRGTTFSGVNFGVGANYGIWAQSIGGLSIQGNTFTTKNAAIAMDNDGNMPKTGLTLGANVYNIGLLGNDPLKAIQFINGAPVSKMSANSTQQFVQPLQLYTLTGTEPTDSTVTANSSVMYQYGQDLYAKINIGGIIKRRSLTGINGLGQANYFPIYASVDSVGKSHLYDDGAKIGTEGRGLQSDDYLNVLGNSTFQGSTITHLSTTPVSEVTIGGTVGGYTHYDKIGVGGASAGLDAANHAYKITSGNGFSTPIASFDINSLSATFARAIIAARATQANEVLRKDQFDSAYAASAFTLRGALGAGYSLFNSPNASTGIVKQITFLGTNYPVIAENDSALFLDFSDFAHLSTTQTFTGNKTFGAPTIFSAQPTITYALTNTPILANASVLSIDNSSGQIQKIAINKFLSSSAVLPEFSGNAAAIDAGYSNGDFYRTGDVVKQVHP